jgi:hypothetical protein
MSKLDWVAAWLLFALGCVHTLIVAPMSFRQLDERALSFVSGGMCLWFAAGLNLVWLADRGRRVARSAALAANLVMLAYVLAYAAAAHQFGKPGAWLLVALVAWLAARSALVALAPRSRAL